MGRWIAAKGELDRTFEVLTEWPAAEIARVGPENIRVLNLEGNKLTAIDGEQLAWLSRLEVLRLPNNRLMAIPAEVGRLSALERLDVSWNQLTAIPAEVWRLSALKGLWVNNNRLTAIPAEVGRLSALERLWVSYNPLTAIPAEVGRLSALKELYVGNSRLMAIPAEVGRLSALKELHVSNSQLTAIPVEVGRLSALKVLDVSCNKLTAIPAEVGGLSALERLDVRDNRLTAIPAEVGRLSALVWLDVSNNQLTAIPAEVGRLSSLKGLYVRDNRLTAIPAEVGRLPLLTAAGLSTRGNPLTDLPGSTRVSDDAVLAYLRSLPLHAVAATAPPPPAPKPVPAPAPAPAPPAPSPPPAPASTAPPKAASPAPAAAVRDPRQLSSAGLPAPHLPSQPTPPRPAQPAPHPPSPPLAPAYPPPVHAPPQRPAPLVPPAASAAPTGDPRRWSEAQVVAWVQSLGALAEFAPCFRFTNGHALLALDKGELEHMGIAPYQARQALHANIGVLAAQSGVARMELAGVSAPPSRPQSGWTRPSAAPLAPGLTHHVFLSYRRVASDRAQLVHDRLVASGFAVFWDQSLQAGPFDEQILERIDTSACFVLLLTAGALDGCSKPGDWLRREIAQACRLRKAIVPVLCEGASFPAEDAMPADIRACKRHQATRWVPGGKFVDISAAELAQAVARVCGEAAADSQQAVELVGGANVQDGHKVEAVLRWARATGAVGRELKANEMQKRFDEFGAQLEQQHRAQAAMAAEQLKQHRQLLEQMAEHKSMLYDNMLAVLNVDQCRVPSFYVLVPSNRKDRKWWKPGDWVVNKVRLHLLCECPGKVHMTDHEGYPIDKPKEFLAKAGPYIAIGLKLLSLALNAAVGFSVPEPIVEFAGTLGIDALGDRGLDGTVITKRLGPDAAEQLKAAAEEIEKLNAGKRSAVTECRDGMRRALEELLRGADPTQSLGGLRKTLLKSSPGTVCWLCPAHAAQFGLAAR